MSKEITINYTDYLDVDVIKNICVEVLRSKLNKEAERILSNMSYDIAHGIINEILTPEQLDMVKKKTEDILSDVSSYNVFRAKNVWDRDESVAYKALREAMVENTPLIHEKVKEAIINHDYESLICDSEPEDFVDFILRAMKKGLKD